MSYSGVQGGSVPAGALNSVHLILSEVVGWQLVEGDGSLPHYFFECFYVMAQWLFEFLTVPAHGLEQMPLRAMCAQLRAVESSYIGRTGAFIFILSASV